jgi:hypothetical protein
MFVTLFDLTSDEGRDAPDASSKRRVVDVKGSPRADDLLGRGDFAPRWRPLLRSVVSAIHFCRPPIGPYLVISEFYLDNSYDWFRRKAAVADRDRDEDEPWRSVHPSVTNRLWPLEELVELGFR